MIVGFTEVNHIKFHLYQNAKILLCVYYVI